MRVADSLDSGPMTIPYFGGSTVAFLPLQNVTADYQDIITSASALNLSSILPTNTDSTIIAGYQAQIDILLDLYKSPHAAVEEVAWGGGNTVCVAMIRPLSRGSILINTTDPTQPPAFDFGTFSHPTDLEVAVKAVKKVRDWMASTPMQDIGAHETFPGANFASDGEIETAIRRFAVSSWQHPTSTCSMLKREFGGVVDSELRVFGVQGLRIVDASVFPMAVAGHTSSTVYAVAEKVSFACNVVIVDFCTDVHFAVEGGRYYQGGAEMILTFRGVRWLVVKARPKLSLHGSTGNMMKVRQRAPVAWDLTDFKSSLNVPSSH